MNKKYITPLMVILGIGLVVAVAGYYVLNTDTFNVNNINGMGTTEYTLTGDYEFGDVISGTLISLENDLSSNRNLLITSGGSEDIAVEYKSTLELTKKDVDFTKNVWDVLEGKVQIEYTIVGDEFSAEVVTGAISGYELIYYADNPDRFNDVSTAISVDVIEENLPYLDDENAEGGDYDYSAEYTTSHGAKIWYVPSDAIPGGVVDWSRASEFYFESKLIQYNEDGEITFYSGDSLDITPEYTPDEHAVGPYTIETTIA